MFVLEKNNGTISVYLSQNCHSIKPRLIHVSAINCLTKYHVTFLGHPLVMESFVKWSNKVYYYLTVYIGGSGWGIMISE